ncbi:hypothetical protein INT45_007641 [Circinella minor]|uniref:Reverse transcriptase zinc-binding domain-containing protein n=1 Tax=Circinella minor TaxID=1195481 RepID=A0A8H7VLH2_9FUNG|nr:hypothetical protein INT45_007641 [Circinella minor]
MPKDWLNKCQTLVRTSSTTSTSIIITSAPAPSAWRRFWRLQLPHNIHTTWWCFLLNRISNKVQLHRVFPSKHITNICPICGDEVETLRHFVLDCPLKFTFWAIALPKINAPDTITHADIWKALQLKMSTLHHPFLHHHLDALRLIFQTIWAMHWHTVIDRHPWLFLIAESHLDSLISRSPFIILDSIL